MKKTNNFPQPLSTKKAKGLIEKSIKNKNEWEKVHKDAWRMRVEKGWVLEWCALEPNNNSTFLFVPDLDHTWEL